MSQALPGVADPAVHLDRGLADGAGRGLAVDLGDLRQPQRLRRGLLVHCPGGVAKDGDRPLDEREPLGEQVRDGLVAADHRPVLAPDPRVRAGERLRAARRAELLGRRDDNRQCLPADRVRDRDLPGRAQLPADRRDVPGEVGPNGGRAQRSRQQPGAVQDERRRQAAGVHRPPHGYRQRRTGQRPQRVREGRTEERHVHQAPRQLGRDQRDLHAAGPVGAQRPPAGRGDRLLQPPHPVGLGQVEDRVRAKVVGQLRRRGLELRLLSRQARVHRAP